MAFEIEFTPQALADLKALKKNDQGYIVDAIEAQLRQEPAGGLEIGSVCARTT